MAQWLDPKAPMLARILQRNGYSTGHFGKWHMGGQRDVDDAPAITEYGFDKSLTNFEGMGPKLLPLTLKPNQKEPGRIWSDAERLGDGFRWTLRSKITEGFVDEAIPFMKNQLRIINLSTLIFGLTMCMLHFGRQPTNRRGLENFTCLLLEMDRQLDQLFNCIKNIPELRKNTLVMVCSDNGPERRRSCWSFFEDIKHICMKAFDHLSLSGGLGS